MPIGFRIRIGTGGDRSFGWEFFPGDTSRGSAGRVAPERGAGPRRAVPVPVPRTPPQPTVPPPNTFPFPGAGGTTRPPFGGFPGGVAANDPVFSIGRAILRKGLGILGGFGIIADLLTLISERGLEQALEDLLFEKVVGARRGRIMTERAPREVVVATPPPSQTLPDLFPEGVPPPKIPEPIPVPTRFPIEIPGQIRVNIPIGPQIGDILLPDPPTIPTPQPPGQPTPTPRQTPAGRPAVRVSPLGLPSPRVLPRGVPQNRPLQDPLPLTPPQPGMPPLPGVRGMPFAGPTTLAQPQPQPQTAQDRCQVVKRRRRKKGRCREGFFRETPTQTKYVTWRTTKCGAKSKPKDFIRIGI